MTGPTAVYLLCLITSLVCAALLARAWRRSRSKLLLWTALAFGFLAINNLFLVADMILFAEMDLRWAQLAQHDMMQQRSIGANQQGQQLQAAQNDGEIDTSQQQQRNENVRAPDD